MIASYIQAFIVLIFVLALIALCAIFLRKYYAKFVGGVSPSASKDIKVTDTVFLNTKLRVMVLSYQDRRKYLLAVQDDKITIIDKFEFKS